ncbi:MAG: VCBS repeat-containing protein [Bacteroidota bacterium]
MTRFLMKARASRQQVCVLSSLLLFLSVSGRGGAPSVGFFGLTVDRTLEYFPGPLGVVEGPGGELRIVVGERDAPFLRLYRISGDGSLMETEKVRLGTPARDLTVVSPPRGDVPTLVCLGRAGDSVTLCRGWPLRPAVAYPLRERAERVRAADVNNDGRPDVVACGREGSGVQVLYGRKSGGLEPARMILEDVSVADVAVLDLNGDRISDMVALPWLGEKAAVYFGIGRGVFAEQIALDLPGDPSRLAVARASPDRTTTLVVGLAGEPAIVRLVVSAAGELVSACRMETPGTPGELLLEDMNADGLPDLALAAGSVIGILPDAGRCRNDGPVWYGGGEGVGPMQLLDAGGGVPDLVYLDAAGGRLALLGNAHRKGRSGWPPQFAVGGGPSGLAVRDLDRDGRMDLACANTVSGTVSVVRRTAAGFSAQEQIRVLPEPVSVHATSPADSGLAGLVALHPRGERVTVVNLYRFPHAPRTYSLVTAGAPRMVLAHRDSVSGKLELLVGSGEADRGSIALTLYEQAQGGKFLERTVRPVLPGLVRSLLVGDLARSGTPDLVALVRENSRSALRLMVAPGRGLFSFGPARPVLEFPDSGGTAGPLLGADLNGDGLQDLVLVVRGRQPGIGIVYGRKGKEFGPGIQWIRGILPIGEDHILVDDLDGDGLRDILCLDSLTRTLTVIRQGRGGVFGSPVPRIPGRGVTGFQIGHLMDGPGLDIVVSEGGKGRLTILENPFLR